MKLFEVLSRFIKLNLSLYDDGAENALKCVDCERFLSLKNKNDIKNLRKNNLMKTGEFYIADLARKHMHVHRKY